MEAHVIADKCVGCRLCADTCPEVFTMSEETNTAVAVQGDVPGAAEQKVRDAAADCPTEAIRVEP